MAFDDSIDEKKPLGTDMVSDVDAAIRETRTWIKGCLKKISGYFTILAFITPMIGYENRGARYEYLK